VSAVTHRVREANALASAARAVARSDARWMRCLHAGHSQHVPSGMPVQPKVKHLLVGGIGITVSPFLCHVGRVGRVCVIVT